MRLMTTGPPPNDAAPRVLFLGDEDACRSIMAAAYLRAMSRGRVAPIHAGVVRGEVDPSTTQVMEEAGIDLPGIGPRHASELMAASFDVVVTLGDRAREFLIGGQGPAETGAQSPAAAAAESNIVLRLGAPVHLHWSLPRPPHDEPDRARRLAAYRELRDLVAEHVRSLLGHGYLPALVCRRQAMERLVDALDAGILVHDERRRVVLFNRAAERITGRRREDVLGRECARIFDPDGLCGGLCRYRPGAAFPTEPTRSELAFVTPQGDERRLRVASHPMDLHGGAARGLLLVIRDVTEVATLRRRFGERHSFHGMVGTSDAMQEVFEMIRQVTASDYPVLITGESGTGKEMVAAAIHNESRRQGGPFVPINCGALPEQILESELFGHVRGAFTGAIRDKKGRFELADGGTIFLDEVGELTPAFQVKLLRVLEEKRFERVGSEKTVRGDVRVVAATNRDLAERVRRGAFREDLFYRLAVVPIRLPPLRDRLGDLPLLVEQILGDVRQETGKPIRAVSDLAMDLLLAYGWPGNVRELINALRFASVRCAGETIEPVHLPPETRGSFPAAAPPLRFPAVPSAPPANGRKEPGRKRKLDAASVERALAQAGGNKVRAAMLLGVGRATLYRFLATRTA